MAPRQFQSTRPVWGATCFAIFGWILFEFQSTRPVWGATFRNIADYYKVQVSIHAPRVGRDSLRMYPIRRARRFNPRAPCGARRGADRPRNRAAEFQSTRPVWGATRPIKCQCVYARVSIHAPRVGRDHVMGRDEVEEFAFQSTRPVWGATFPSFSATSSTDVSIHAPRVGRDFDLYYGYSGPWCFNPRAPCGARPIWRSSFGVRGGFNPRAPCGARPQTLRQVFVPCPFQSTRPVWGATIPMICVGDETPVSIHAPRVGRDRVFYDFYIFFPSFNPRAPCGARQRQGYKYLVPDRFQSTRPVWGATH